MITDSKYACESKLINMGLLYMYTVYATTSTLFDIVSVIAFQKLK